MENRILIDWLTVTSKTLDVNGIKEMLGMEHVPWQFTKGYYGYKSRYYYECISIHFDGSESMGVCLEMSGQGCRAFETFGHGDFDRLFRRITEETDLRVTRLDIAYDDHTGILDINKIFNDADELKHVVTRSRAWQVVSSNKGKSIEIGSKQSMVLVRIYDKARERGFNDGRHWVRVEMQLRDDRALAFLKLPLSVGENYFNVLCNYLCFVTPNGTDTNKSRWELAPYWAEFLDDAYKQSIYVKPGMEYNLSNVDNFVFNNAGNAIDCAIECYGLEDFLDKLHNRKVRQNPKYTAIIEQHKYVKDDLDDVIEQGLKDGILEKLNIYGTDLVLKDVKK